MSEEDFYELDKGETLRRLATSKLKRTLVYATKPDLKPLAFVKDPSDVVVLIRQKLSESEGRARAAAETDGRETTSVATTVAMRRWQSARWVELELDPEAPEEPNETT